MDKKNLLIGAALAGLVASGCANQMSKGSDTMMAKGECHGINACKGQGECGGAGHSCAGHNECKGKGWTSMSKADCEGKGGTFKGN